MSPSSYRNTIFNQSSRVISLGLFSILNLYIDGNSQIRAQFHCENTAIPITKDSEMAGATVDDNIKFERHICMQKSLKADRCSQANDPSI